MKKTAEKLHDFSINSLATDPIGWQRWFSQLQPGERQAQQLPSNLSYADLSGWDLRWANLAGCDLRWSNLSWANLDHADLEGAQLSGAKLRGISARYTNFRSADLSYTTWENAELCHADLTGADLDQINLIGSWAHQAVWETPSGENPLYGLDRKVIKVITVSGTPLGDKAIRFIKLVRDHTELSLKESKEIYDTYKNQNAVTIPLSPTSCLDHFRKDLAELDPAIQIDSMITIDESTNYYYPEGVRYRLSSRRDYGGLVQNHYAVLVAILSQASYNGAHVADRSYIRYLARELMDGRSVVLRVSENLEQDPETILEQAVYDYVIPLDYERLRP
jgi:uncharacterized protein YjbI with pentapeptide repeats